MNFAGKSHPDTFFFIAAAGIFIVSVSPNMLSDGMFIDGLLYAVLSKNLAHGIGTFWQPHMTDTLFPVFINHPPLQFGLESIFFRILGDSRYAERLYSFAAIIVTAILITAVWRSAGKKADKAWLPLLAWIAIPSVSWAAVNNMLENTTGIFICLSVLAYMRIHGKYRLPWLITAGLALSAGFLTKGFVTLFPLSFPFFSWMFMRKRSFLQMAGDTVIIALSAAIPLVIIYTQVPGARAVLPEYLEITFGFALDSATKNTRFYIVYRLLMELLPVILVSLAFAIYCRRKNIGSDLIKGGVPASATFFFFGLAGVLPIMITRVQSGYYLLPAMPFFSLSFAFLAEGAVNTLVSGINVSSQGYKFFKITSIIVLAAGVVLTVAFSGVPHRDRNKIADMKMVLTVVPANSIINILPEMNSEWNLHGYYARYGNISLDPELPAMKEYLLVRKSLYSDTLSNKYEKAALRTVEYDLFVRKPGNDSIQEK